MKAVLGIGTNIGDRAENIQNAQDALSLVPNVKVLRCSSVYETEPWGYTEQRSFYNNVIEIETELSPNALLGVCLGIEAGMGRVRSFKNGPRVIDVDVLLCDGYVCESDELTVPHPRMFERDFVLVPLKELFGGFEAYGVNFEKAYSKYGGNSTIKIISKK